MYVCCSINTKVMWPHNAISVSYPARKKWHTNKPTHTHTYSLTMHVCVCVSFVFDWRIYERKLKWSLDKKWNKEIDRLGFISTLLLLLLLYWRNPPVSNILTVKILPVHRHGLVIIRTWRILDVKQRVYCCWHRLKRKEKKMTKEVPLRKSESVKKLGFKE